MSNPEEQAAAAPVGLVIPVWAIAWAVVGGLYLLLRLGPIWQAPVGGAELDHLSGAWQAHLGLGDARFVPTLSQWMTALTFTFTDSEVPARIIVYLAGATVPLALYLLRPRLGESGALLALLLLAFDGPLIHFSSAATALAFDVPLALWLAVLVSRPGMMPEWGGAPLAAGAVLSGPLALPLVLAAAVVTFARSPLPPRLPMAYAASGAVAGLLVAMIEPGGGIGFTIPPFEVFGQGFDRAWSTANATELAVLYNLPVLTAGVASAVWLLWGAYRGVPLSRWELTVLGWAGLSAIWMLAGLASEQALPNAALSLPLALLAGLGLPRAFAVLAGADWRIAVYVVGAALLFTFLAYYPAAEWARLDDVRGGRDVFLFIAGILAVTGAIAYLLANTNLRSAALAYPAALGGILLAAGGFGVGLSAQSEPLPSPVSTGQARELRDLALAIRAAEGGSIAVHIGLSDDVTWPFRDSGDIVVSSFVPEDAVIVIWLPSLPQPEGYLPVSGAWALTEALPAPGNSWLDWVEWLGDRNSTTSGRHEVAVYIRAPQ